MGYSHFFDQILEQVEAGHVHDGIMQLSGMLDALVGNEAVFEDVKAELRDHLLWQLLLQEPGCSLASRLADPTELVDLYANDELPVDAGSTGRYLFRVTAQFFFARAIRSQHERIATILVKAWKSGRRIGLIGGERLVQRHLASKDISNIEYLSPETLKAAALRRFDLILEAGFGSILGRESVPCFFAQVPQALVNGGAMHLVNFAPGHAGAGWLSACLNIDPARHGEAELAALASRHGLTFASYRDASGSLICSELSLPTPLLPRGEIR